ncbi:redoxin domain-containing protein [Streptomyces aquilus]|uniref:redoxin domain-containing protein n=1 Tax=Streptomyces aquilus TaxID=2548456 RepID=UPI0036992F9F
MPSIDDAPAAVRGWFAARASTEPAAKLREVFAPEILFEFAGRRIQGVPAVVEHLASMPSDRLGTVEWSVLPGGDDTHVTVRGTGPGGKPLPSPGGPMSAMDFAFTLRGDGLITRMTPRPHHTEPGDLAQPLQPGDTAPDFSLPDVAGDPVRLHDADAVATVVLWTCNPCPWALGWHDRLQQVARDYADQGVRFLQINANDPAVSPKDALEDSRKRVAEGQFAGPYLIDEGQTVARLWGARHTPDVFVLRRDGVVTYHGAPDAGVDDASHNADWLRSALDSVLKGSAPDLTHTKPVGCTIKWTL